MVFSTEDQIQLTHLYEFMGYGDNRLIRKFPRRGGNIVVYIIF